MEMLGIVRKAKNMAFQPQFAQCFTVTTYLPQTCIISNPKTYLLCGILQTKELQIPVTHPNFGSPMDKTVMDNAYSKFLYLFQIKL
jgi:hypothetical protein